MATTCNVSVSTASQALLGYRQIAKSTRTKVRAAAKRLGYVPNPVLSSLAARQFKPDGEPLAAGLVYLIVEQNGQRHWPFRQGIEREARSLGYQLALECAPASNDAWDSLLKKWYMRGVQGIILGDDPGEAFARHKRLAHFSVMAVSGRWQNSRWHNVRIDPAQCMRTAVETVLARGYRRPGIALAGSGPRYHDDQIRHALALSYARTHPQFVPPFMDSREPERKFLRWFRKHRPDAVIGFPAILPWWLEQDGWRTPEDVAYADIAQIPGRCAPDTAGCLQSDDHIARRVIQLMDGMIRHGESGPTERPMEIYLPPDWNEGASLPPLQTFPNTR